MKKEFRNVFKKEGEVSYFSPGRVNLIGEHIDYNGGHVLPCALSIGTMGVFAKNSKRTVRLFSQGFSKEIYSFEIDNLIKEEKSWSIYIKGIIFFFDKIKRLESGFDLLISSNLPIGSGLSSSASVEMLIAKYLNDEFSYNLTPLQLVQIAKKVENEYVGVSSGIMDQFAVTFSKENGAVLLDCNTLDYSYVALQLKEYYLVVANTKKVRRLEDSKYNERVSECTEALKILNKNGISGGTLCEISSSHLLEIKKLLPDTLYKRVKHCISEEERTLKAKQYLNSGNIVGFAQLLNESHASLRDDYLVSCFELDTLVDLINSNGGIGARMTGAGFGGCTVSIIPQDLYEKVVQTVSEQYLKKVGYLPEFYLVKPSEGVHKL
ncbi:MAG: galactokinase [Bacillales bacterium]|jgi:galactokinase|nr:galactokinase [Bacillales bacterium]